MVRFSDFGVEEVHWNKVKGLVIVVWRAAMLIFVLQSVLRTVEGSQLVADIQYVIVT